MLSKRLALLSIPLFPGFVQGDAISSSTSWNGQITQTTMSASFLGSGEYVPINRFLDSRDWATVIGNGPVDVSIFNSNGFPSDNNRLSVVGGWWTTFALPTSTDRPGNYNVVVTGGGPTRINPGGSIVSVSGSGCTISGLTFSGPRCTAVVNYKGRTSPKFEILAVAGGGPTSIQVYNVNDASLISAGYVCRGTKFASTVGANFGVIRDLNRSFANYSNVAFWSDRTPTSWWSYGANNYFPSSLLTSNAIILSSGAQYNLAFPGFNLSDKAHIIAKPASNIVPPSSTAAQTANSGVTLTLDSVMGLVPGMVAGDANSQNAMSSTVKVASIAGNMVTFTSSPFTGTVTKGDMIYFSPMLNVNNTGSIPLVTNSAMAFGTQNSATTFYAHWSTITYDAQLGVWLVGNNAKFNIGLQGGTPPEIFTQCANEIGAHPWYVMPVYAMDPPTDYASQLATYAKNNLLSGLIPRFEPPNEDWNYEFFGTIYSDNKEFARNGLSFDHDDWYGRVASQMGQTVSTVYAGDRTKYQMLACMNTTSVPEAHAISSGFYNAATGQVTVNLASAPPFLQAGSSVFVRGLTGTGSIESTNGAFTAQTGSIRKTLVYKIEPGLTLSILPSTSSYMEFGSQNQGARLTSPEYVSTGGSAAYNWITHICPPAYYQSAFSGTIAEIGWAFWYVNGASSGQKDALINDYLAGTSTKGFGGNLNWLQNSIFPGFSKYLATYVGTAEIGYSMYEGGYTTSTCGYSYQCSGGLMANPTAAVTSVSLGITTTLTVGVNAWDYICNTANLCKGRPPTTKLTFGGGCQLNGLDPAVLLATNTTITIGVDSTSFKGCTTGSASYDGAGGSGGYATTFELGVKQNTNPSNLIATEKSFLQSFYAAGGRFPAEYVDSDTTDWGKYVPDVYQTNTPVVSAVQAFQISP